MTQVPVVGYPDGLLQNGSNSHPGIGRDACQGSNAWVNGLLPTSAAYPLHPNQTGESNLARQVEGAL
jgi:hypothetical protein